MPGFHFEIVDLCEVVGQGTIEETDPDAATQAALTALLLFVSRRPELRANLAIKLRDSEGRDLGRVTLPRVTRRRGKGVVVNEACSTAAHLPTS